MKKLVLILTMVLMSITLSASAGTTSCAPTLHLDNLVVEQTITFNDGKTAVLYYRVEDGCVALYSESDVSRYTLDDLLNVKESKERRVSSVRGMRYAKYSFAAIRKYLARWLKE